MNSAILLGLFWHFVGAASAACFYAPFKKVRHWSWETMWSLGGFFSWIILPWSISALLLPDFWGYFGLFSFSTLLPVFLFAAMWGIGNINYELTMRYLGMSLGIGIAIGITLIIGTLMTPLLQGKFMQLFGTTGGQLSLVGVGVALIGVGVVSYAGLLKERALGIRAQEFNLKKGLMLAVMCGIFSAGMSFAMDAAKPLLITNALFSILGGMTWYLQFFFYAWGHANIPADYTYLSWMLHMSFYVLCGGIVGLLLKEWNNVGHKPVSVLVLGGLIIILAANIVGMGMAS